ncbi:hypothetical protein PtrV1_10543 [Pyrenophora tritici-repentis]|nr:hypothetical protein PtrV1_10543 [Pyrenophora tritici-repentis]KAI0569922.1 hypothetical protein Alg215_11367 [Pyrenophora tritici-repentis]
MNSWTAMSLRGGAVKSCDPVGLRKCDTSRQVTLLALIERNKLGGLVCVHP